MKGLTYESVKFIFEHYKLVSISGLISLIYIKEYEEVKGIKYMEMKKKVMKIVDRFRLDEHLKLK